MATRQPMNQFPHNACGECYASINLHFRHRKKKYNRRNRIPVRLEIVNSVFMSVGGEVMRFGGKEVRRWGGEEMKKWESCEGGEVGVDIREAEDVRKWPRKKIRR